MLFNSLQFWCFFPVVYAIYRGLGRSAQSTWLLAASYLFYSAWDVRFLGLIVLSTLVDFVVARRIEKAQSSRTRRRLLWISVVTNLGVLGTFKYAGFFVESLAVLAARFGISLSTSTLDLVLPVGISFYTFQTLGYTIDVYRRRVPACRCLRDFALFVAFFPQLVAGPIERAADLLPQIRAPRTRERFDLRAGSWLILWGLFKKAVLGDHFATVVDLVFDPASDPTGPEVAIAAYAFALQVYCDFSGYSDIARGLAKWLGFELSVNFRLPFLASNPSQLWSRWHITLTMWLRDYVFVPLGGSRRSRSWENHRNIVVTMALSGLWHGAGWTFVLWGALHGVWLAAHRAVRLRRRGGARRRARSWGAWRFLAILATFTTFCLLIIPFRAVSIPQAIDRTRRLFDLRAGLADEWWLPVLVLTLPLALMHWAQTRWRDLDVVLRAPAALQSAVYCALVLGLVLLGRDHGQPFVYFQF